MKKSSHLYAAKVPIPGLVVSGLAARLIARRVHTLLLWTVRRAIACRRLL